jgi:cephalosporin hydroxylase
MKLFYFLRFGMRRGRPAHNSDIDTTVTFNLQGFDKGHHNTTYRGVNCVKAAFDYVIYQMIIEEVKPDGYLKRVK